MAERGDPALEFSRRVRAVSVPPGGLELSVEATASERESLARRFGLCGMSRLEAQVVISPWESGLEVRGTLEAAISQICVVSLEEFESVLRESFHSRFLPARRIGSAPGDFDGPINGPDDPEPLEDGCVDIGELTAQHLSLSLDPAPRKEGEPKEGKGEGRPGGAFSALSRAKK